MLNGEKSFSSGPEGLALIGAARFSG